MHRLNKKYFDLDLSYCPIPSDVLREEPDEEEDEEKDGDNNEDDDEGDEGYSE